MAQDPQKASLDQEHNDLAEIMYHAVHLEQACVTYVQDANSNPVKYRTRSTGTFDLLVKAINALLVDVTVAVPDPPLLSLQHQVNLRVQNIDPKNGGFS